MDQAQQQPMPFNDQHNAVYNSLRSTIQQYVAAGVPGMDKVADALNKQHIANMPNYQPPTNKPVAATQMPGQAQPQGQAVNPAQLSDLMATIRQRNTPALPNGYSGYSQ